MLCTLFIRALIAILSPGSKHSNMIAMSAFNACWLFLLKLFFYLFVCFTFGMPCNCFLITTHDVLSLKKCSKLTFSKVIVRCYRRRSILLFIIRFQSFGEAKPLDCKLYNNFSVFIFPLVGRGWLELTVGGVFPSPR